MPAFYYDKVHKIYLAVLLSPPYIIVARSKQSLPFLFWDLPESQGSLGKSLYSISQFTEAAWELQLPAKLAPKVPSYVVDVI